MANPECFKLWPCNGSNEPFTTSTDLSSFVGNNIIVSSLSPSNNINNVCVFVENISNNDCTNAIDIVVNANSCECPCTCYTIIGEIRKVEWIDCFGVYNFVDAPLSPFEICAGTYPLAAPLVPNNPLQVINNGLCIESTIFNNEIQENETVFNCELVCYLLEDCLDNTNVIYSNSTSLLGPANLGQVVTIAGHTECWKILIPQECICPINVSVLTASNSCESCLPNINYKLTLCNDSTAFTYTSDDLSFYVNKVIRREDCPEKCWIVSKINGDIPIDIPIVVLEDYLDCESCNKNYYLLEDCLGLELDIITYTDLSEHVDKVITLDWCPETCWRVTETIVDDNAGVISNILDSYNECFDCITNAPCICSTIKNYNDIALSYKYLDCESHLQTITLQPNQKSDRLCLVRWYVPEPCDELIVTITSSVGVVSNIKVYQSSANHPVPVIVNDKPTWKDAGNNLYIYYNGTKWILSKNFTPSVLPSVYNTIGFINCNGDCDCPTGTWQQSSSIPNQDVYITTELKYTIEYFGNCINGVCPPIKNKQKSVTPGYNTPGCEAWKYEEISCRAADAMYKQVLELRYGISNCCPEEDEQYIVQKELIDLAALNDPTYPCSTNSCGCNNNCNCSTAKPVCPPIPLTYNCFCTHTGCECIERGDGSGEYSTLALCQTSCVPIPVTYNCVNNNCTNPGDGSGEYLTLEACEEECQPVTTYNCTNGSCVPVSGPLGEFPTLQDCEDDCQPVTSYNCFYGNCVLVSGSSGEYPTLQACEIDCSPPPVTSYNCTNGECILVSGSGGEYPTLIACQDNCDPLTSYNCTDCECIIVSGSGGNFPTLEDCIDAGCSDDSFITIWETTTAGESITLPYLPPAFGSVYTGVIDWGDSTTSINDYTNRTHTYANAGTHTITICGTVYGWSFVFTTASAAKITSVVTWGQFRVGPSAISPGGGYFYGCTNLDLSLVSDVLDLTGVLDLGLMFNNCTSLTTINNINLWNTSAITSMNAMFSNCTNFNQPLSFNTSLVQDMSGMFANCSVFDSLLTFNTISVTTTNIMFSNCTNFNQPLPWNTGLVQDMSYMFSSAPAFQQDISSWDITNVTNFTGFMLFKTPATWSQTNFDLLLCGWSFQSVNPNLIIDFGSANYTNLTGGPCRTVLQGAPNLWNIFSGPGV